MKKNIKYMLGAAAVPVIGLIIWGASAAGRPGPLDGFAQCLDEQDAKFYGAYWCPHCQDQKDLFGKSDKYLPYVECSTVNGQGMLSICKDAGVEGYPTWIFADDSKQSGYMSLDELADKTGCELPDNSEL